MLYPPLEFLFFLCYNFLKYAIMEVFMKTKFIRILSALLALTFVLAVCPAANQPVEATSYRTGMNGASTSYKNGAYYEKLLRVPLTGDGITDVLAVALSQTGYQEGDSSSQMSGTVSGSSNYTEFCYNMGDWGSGYGGSGYPWCATFVTWALYQARVSNATGYDAWCRNNVGDSNYIWCEVSCTQWLNQLKRFDRAKASAYHGGSYIPQPGDLIFFSWSASYSTVDHIGIVVYSDGTNVYTIEGNTSDAEGLEDNGGGAYFKSYALGYKYISAYGKLPYVENSNVPDIDYSGANPTPGLYVATNSAKYVYTSETSTTYNYTMPRYTMFEVTEIASNNRLKVKYTSGSTTITGYVNNNSDRVVQITSTETESSTESGNNIAYAATYKGEGIDNGTTGNYCEAPGTDWEVYHTGKLNDNIIPSGDAETTIGSNVEFWHASEGPGTINVYFKFDTSVDVNAVNVFMNDRDNNDDCGYPTKIDVYVGNSEDVSSATYLGEAKTSSYGYVRKYTVKGSASGSYVILQFTSGTQWRITCSEVQIFSDKVLPGSALPAPVIKGNLSRMETYEAPVISWEPVEGAVSYDAYIDGVLVTSGITGTSYVPDMEPVIDYEYNTDYTQVQIKAKGDGETYKDSALSSAYNFFYVEKPLDLRGNRVTSADVIIDPGHGGSQPGACYGTRQEKDDTLNMSLALGRKLESMGFTVAFCRIEDVDDGLMSRAAKANAGDYKLFLGIHRNSYDNSANGVETLYETNDALDKAYAQAIQDSLVSLGIFTDRGLKARDNLVVIGNTRDDLPYALVELGFIDTTVDNDAFDNYFQQIALAMAEGCANYLNKRLDCEATVTVDDTNYTYSGTALNITAETPDVSFVLGNGYGISGVTCTDGAGTYSVSYTNTELTGFQSAVSGSFVARAEAASNSTVVTTLKYKDGFGVEKTIATISCKVVLADPFTFKAGATVDSISLDTQKGYITFDQSAMKATDIMALFADTDMKVTGANGSTVTDFASTGCFLSTTVNGVTSTVGIVVYGDIDGDCISSSADYQLLKLSIMEKAVLEGAYSEAADIVHDEELSTADLMLIRLNIINNA